VENRPGCLTGILKIFLIEKIYTWLQAKFGFGKGGCCGCGCGVLLLVIMIGFVCSVLTGTDWTRIGF